MCCRGRKLLGTLRAGLDARDLWYLVATPFDRTVKEPETVFLRVFVLLLNETSLEGSQGWRALRSLVVCNGFWAGVVWLWERGWRRREGR
jgi:hypothetical protein